MRRRKLPKLILLFVICLPLLVEASDEPNWEKIKEMVGPSLGAYGTRSQLKQLKQLKMSKVPGAGVVRNDFEELLPKINAYRQSQGREIFAPPPPLAHKPNALDNNYHGRRFWVSEMMAELTTYGADKYDSDLQTLLHYYYYAGSNEDDPGEWARKRVYQDIANGEGVMDLIDMNIYGSGDILNVDGLEQVNGSSANGPFQISTNVNISENTNPPPRTEGFGGFGGGTPIISCIDRYEFLDRENERARMNAEGRKPMPRYSHFVPVFGASRDQLLIHIYSDPAAPSSMVLEKPEDVIFESNIVDMRLETMERTLQETNKKFEESEDLVKTQCGLEPYSPEYDYCETCGVSSGGSGLGGGGMFGSGPGKNLNSWPTSDDPNLAFDANEKNRFVTAASSPQQNPYFGDAMDIFNSENKEYFECREKVLSAFYKSNPDMREVYGKPRPPVSLYAHTKKSSDGMGSSCNVSMTMASQDEMGSEQDFALNLFMDTGRDGYYSAQITQFGGKNLGRGKAIDMMCILNEPFTKADGSGVFEGECDFVSALPGSGISVAAPKGVSNRVRRVESDKKPTPAQVIIDILGKIGGTTE